MDADKEFAKNLIKYIKQKFGISDEDYHRYYVETHPLTRDDKET